MPPVLISWESPAEERAVGDGAFCGHINRSYGVVRGGIDDEKRRAAPVLRRQAKLNRKGATY